MSGAIAPPAASVGRPPAWRWVVPLALLPIATVLTAAVGGGLLRAGVPLVDSAALGRAALNHAALMIGGFFGTVIGIERAVALHRRLGWPGPAASLAAGIALLVGAAAAGAVLLLGASLLLVGVSAALARRRPGAPAGLRVAGAACWLSGNMALAAGMTADATTAWWFAFLVMTVVAERLEMARLVRHDAQARRWLLGILGVLVAGAASSAPAPIMGGVLYGTALLALAAWLARRDVGRRSLHASGLPRYIAACLLSASAWLGVAGLAWATSALGWPLRDVALHALGLGFVVAMMMGHAPVVLPALARIKMRYAAFLYAPLALLQVSLLLRFAGSAVDPGWRATGALLNAAALALFVLALAGGAIAWRRREAASFPS